MKRVIVCCVALMAFMPESMSAQVQQRIQGANGWLLPVTGNVLSSDEAMHLRRGSVNAWDLTVPHGSPVFPMAPGRITYAGCNNAGGFGCWVEIDHGQGIETRYAHMVLGSIQVTHGQQVGQWDVLGRVGWTGKTSFGPHVHFQIHVNGQRTPIRQFFDVGLMNKCDFCEAKGQPVEVSRSVVAGRPAEGNQSPATNMAWSLAQPSIPLDVFVSGIKWMVLVILLTIMAIAYLLGNSRGWLVSSTANGTFLAMACLLLISPAWMALFDINVRPALASGNVASAPSQVQPIQGSSKWAIAYAAMRQWEGTKCVHDPGRTFRGVTQSTLNSWRTSKGLPAGDVCEITESEAEHIYYERYWLKSGADKMPQGLSITHFDFAVNAGPGRAMSALRACGTDVACYNDYRERFYRSSKSFHLYGAGWMNRLNSIRRLTEGKG